MPQRSLGCAAVAAWLFTVAVMSDHRPVEMAVDPAGSHVVILVGKAGLLSFASHAHEVVAPGVSGRVTFDPADWQRASVTLEFAASAMQVTGKGEPAADVPEVQRVMLGARVLDTGRYPTISFRSSRVTVTAPTATSAIVLIEGDMTLHGTTRPMSVRAAVTLDAGGVTARGNFSLKQTDFGMVPVTAAGGTIRVKDELDIRFVLRASHAHEASSTR